MPDNAPSPEALIASLRATDVLVLVGVILKPNVELKLLLNRLPIRRWRARRAVRRLLERNLIEGGEEGRYVATTLGEETAKDWLMSAEVASFEPHLLSSSRRHELKAPFPTDWNPWL